MTACCEEESLAEIKKAVSETQQSFPLCRDFTCCELTRNELYTTVGCMAYILKHDIKCKYSGGNRIIFHCAKPCVDGKSCPFYLEFARNRKSGTPALFSLHRNTSGRTNTISRNCSSLSFPSFCRRDVVYQGLISGYVQACGKPYSGLTTDDVATWILHRGDEMGKMVIEASLKQCIGRSLRELKNTSARQLVESQQKIEDYIKGLNSGEGNEENRQYGSLLYDTGELVIPGTEINGRYKMCSLNPGRNRKPAF